MNMKKITLALLLCGVISPVFAENYYVSPTGDNQNSGLTPELPKKHLSAIEKEVWPGDVVYLMDGVFQEYNYTISQSGDEYDGYITWKAYEGAHPVVRPMDGSWQAFELAEGTCYRKFEGIEFSGFSGEAGVTLDDFVKDSGKFNQTGFKIEKSNHHLVFQNCKIHNFPGPAFSMNKVDFLTIEGCEIYNNCNLSQYKICAITIGNPLMQEASESETDLTNRIVIRNNRIYDNVRMNDKTGDPIVVGHGIFLQSNLSGEAYEYGTVIENNLLYNNGGAGIKIDNWANVDIFNNTLYGNGQTTDDSDLSLSNFGNARIANNIVLSTRNTYLASSNPKDNVILTHNLFYGIGDETVSCGENYIIKDPLFVDTEAKDFTLKTASPAIDAGSEMYAPQLDILGNVRKGLPDLGAFECQENGTGIKKTVRMDGQISIYPNPVISDLNISLDANEGETASIFILDAMGRQVASYNARIQEGKCNINVGNLPSGHYVLKISVDNTIGVARIIK